MRFAIAKEHQDFFEKHHFIEFEELISPDACDAIKEESEQILAKRLGTTQQQIFKKSLKDLYLAGRDLWRESAACKKATLSNKLAEIMAQLMKKKPLRIAYDQLILTSSTPPDSHVLRTYPPLFHQLLSLEQISGYKGIVGGLMLHITSPEVLTEQEHISIEEGLEFITPLPQKQGNGIFLSPNVPLKFSDLFETPDQMHLLIVYSEETTLFTHEALDLHNHLPKEMGYSFGDRLQTRTHPIIFS